MRTMCKYHAMVSLSVVLASFWPSLVAAQTFTSGSTGALGAFAPAAHTVVTLPPDGVLNHTTVTIPAGVTVTFVRNAANTPVTMLATGDVTIAGAISINGVNGIAGATAGPVVNPGALGGPGGFHGGNGGSRGGGTPAGAGLGPGGGAPAVVSPVLFGGGGSYGASAAFVSLLPLFGGSGGGGGQGNVTFSGSSGGGGGGAIVLASSTKITVTGAVIANGGSSASAGACNALFSGGGSGGAIRLVAPQIFGAGSLSAAGGGDQGCGGPAVTGPGRIRLEAFTLGFTGASTPAFVASAAPGPVTTTSVPALTNLPTVTFTVGGVVAPSNPGGAYTTADIALPPATTNPVPVTLNAFNLPAGTVFTIRVVPQFGNPTQTTAPGTAGTFAGSTATVNVNFPTGEVSVLNAIGSFTLPQLAGLFPLIDGEPADQVLVAANWGEPSTVTLRAKSGKEMRADQLSHGDQVKLARAWESSLRGR